MEVGVPREANAADRRVALVPATVAILKSKGLEVVVESGAGAGAEYLDEVYREKGALITATRDDVFSTADVILQINHKIIGPQSLLLSQGDK